MEQANKTGPSDRGAPGIILSDEDAVAPDLIWISYERFRAALGQDGKLHHAPELVIEVLSEGADDELRDREIKLDLYSRYLVEEYWLIDWRARSLEIYRRQDAQLIKAATIRDRQIIASQLLPGFFCEVEELFAGIPVGLL